VQGCGIVRFPLLVGLSVGCGFRGVVEVARVDASLCMRACEVAFRCEFVFFFEGGGREGVRWCGLMVRACLDVCRAVRCSDFRPRGAAARRVAWLAVFRVAVAVRWEARI
jgi:hypothetical protein